MTDEAAIQYAEDKIAKLQARMNRPGGMYGDHAVCSAELEFLSAALPALRAQQELLSNSKVVKSTDMFDEDGGEILPKSEPNAQLTGWISVKERLPEWPASFLAVTRWGRVTIENLLSWEDPDLLAGGLRVSKAITHWMPLPEPPEEADHEQ